MSGDHTQPPSDGNALLTAENVGVSFGKTDVLEDVTATVEPGQVVGLVGPNGSGKTTLLRVLAGLLGPTHGTVTYGTDAERPVGYLPQTPAFRPRFTVAETLQFYADLARCERDVADILDEVGLSAAADRRVEALSGGMTRLLGIAQATVGDPPLTMLDEPISGLDPEMADRIFQTVADLASEDGSVLLATHDISGLEAVADHVLLLDEGRIEASGSPASLRETAGTETLREAFSVLVDRGTVAAAQVGRGGSR
ncbi:heme ABC exporter ATP-binding protein CcmA [Haloarculaceae archaeon H-GB2-1]|nr:heme ABC exporter ATP-binding protein CcmA [Haloarculaceae archaeon H-GB1-1]MEA5387051.1 heme ABC exporter ATP-binding protein CcmA [Haloarculaceae archaeon H-GB11]MEA5408553.1 heme ABC exporter ATP-binding protein CcmA [Haloarculaceae archaeon H-GB2-1]